MKNELFRQKKIDETQREELNNVQKELEKMSINATKFYPSDGKLYFWDNAKEDWVLQTNDL